MKEVILNVSAFIATIGSTGYFTFLFTRAKNRQDVEKLKIEIVQAQKAAISTEIDNDIKLSGHYKEILDDLKQRYEYRYKEFEDILNRKISMLEEELKLKDRKIRLQQLEITQLKKENQQLRSHAINSST
ncbi:hypothetical protein GJU43_14065 [Flavobacterium sp. LC2016-23]|uniref:hypothetical protein n=1 Tax=Flavobacterium sp. LC2016-23 TaxID=2666330 RepID=UPI0012B0DAB9|nr:hypothetical protein [Flavobacterium sp. LC2016-23]MRX40409.1 hypothetical protein [Flavobacterium sp. LC2016-23]